MFPSALTLMTFVAAAALAAAVTPAIWRWRGHGGSTRPARLGGVALAIAFGLPLTLAFAWLGPDVVTNSPLGAAGPLALAGMAAGALTILGLGIYDDLRGASPLEKLVVQALVAAATWAVGVRIESFTAFDGSTLLLPDWASAPLTLLWIVGLTNAVNLLDGLDGLAAGVSLIAVCTLFAFGLADHHLILCLVCAALAGSLIGFLVYNFNPARIFMGDSGALLLGYVLAVASILSTTKQYTAWALFLPVLALGLPITDTALAVVRRLRRGQPVTAADTEHVHHRLLRAGYSHRQAVLVLYGVGAVFAAMAWSLKFRHDMGQAIQIAIAGALVFGLIHAFKRHSRRSTIRRVSMSDATRRRLMTRAIRQADDLEALWNATRRSLLAEGVDQIELELFVRPTVTWRHGRMAPTASAGARTARPTGTVTLVLPLLGDDHCFGELRATRARTADPALDTARDIQVHLIGDAIASGLERLTPTLRPSLVVTHLPAR